MLIMTFFQSRVIILCSRVIAGYSRVIAGCSSVIAGCSSVIAGLTRNLIILLCLFVHASCASIPKVEQEYVAPISKNEFAAKPFGFDLTLRNFEENYKHVLKRQRYFMPVQSGNVDTLYSYYKGKNTKILFHQYGRFDGRLVGGKIRKPQIELNNGIRTGLTRREFFDKFTDWYYDESDIIILESVATRYTFTFVFRRNKLKEIKFIVNSAANVR